MPIKTSSSLLIVLLVAVVPAFSGPAPRASSALLPQQFAGWRLSPAVQTSTDPATADGVNGALLKEYGFTDFASATYTREDGHTLRLRAARFLDASGAFGAFTYYKTPEMRAEKIGDQAASLNERVLFFRGNILMDAVFSKLTAMSAAELRELAADLPIPSGNVQSLPGLPGYLPAQAGLRDNARYLEGPVGLQNMNSPIPADLVDFGAGAEVVLGRYDTAEGEASLMLISYPTPQIAADHLRKIEAATRPTGQPGSGSSGMLTQPVFAKRTGPIVVVAAGSISQSAAQSMLAAVNYDANVTWNENTYQSKRDNIGNLVWNALLLCGILMALALVAGLAFGGLRVLVQRIIPERMLHREEQVEFISLHLTEHTEETGPASVSSSIKAV